MLGGLPPIPWFTRPVTAVAQLDLKSLRVTADGRAQSRAVPAL